MAAFDTSWYRRVLVERLEGYCSEADRSTSRERSAERFERINQVFQATLTSTCRAGASVGTFPHFF